MKGALFLSNLKTSGNMILTYAAGSVFYMWLLIWVFPSIAEAKGLNELIESLPEDLRKVMGLENGLQDLGNYISGEFYGLIFLIIMVVFSVMMASQLMVRLVDQGSMAYLLATPSSRRSIAITQALFLIFGLAIISLFTTVGGFLGTEWLIDGYQFETQPFLNLNLVGFLVFLVVAAYSFFFSCLLNDEKQALGASAGLTILFYGLNVAGKLSPDYGWIKKLSLFYTFNPQAIMQGQVDVLPYVLGLSAAALLLFAAAVTVFEKRDLPL